MTAKFQFMLNFPVDRGMAGRMMDSAMEMTERAAENAKPMGIAGVVLALISLFGVWQMWNLKKSGFWLYVLAAIGGLAVPIVYIGGSMMAGRKLYDECRAPRGSRKSSDKKCVRPNRIPPADSPGNYR